MELNRRDSSNVSTSASKSQVVVSWYNEGIMAFFNVIIPTFNCEKTLLRAVNSVRKQTYKDYNLIIVDDLSTDKTREVIRGIKEADVILLDEKRWNGGTRNVAVENSPAAVYTLFLDADDEFIDEHFFQKLHDFVIKHDYPDMVRLPYVKHYDATNHERVISARDFNERTVADVAHSPRVAAWTKAVKYELLCPFPENTLMEDVCQHLLQCDITETVAWFPEPVVRWHINGNSTSHSESPKWKSSAWRFIADLMDLELEKDYTRARRDGKVRRGGRALLNGKFEL